MRVLVLCSDSTRNPANSPRPHGLLDFQSRIEQVSDIRFEIRLGVPLRDFPGLVKQGAVDAVCLLLHWDHPIDAMTEVVEQISQLPSRPRLIQLDQVDQTCVPFPKLIKHFDVVLKSQMLSDKNRYTQLSRSGYVFADYLAETQSYNLGDWHFGEPVDPADLPKLRLGWNLGISRRVRRLLRWSKLSPVPWRYRRFDFNCRLGSQPENDHGWYATYRRFALERLLAATRGAKCTGHSRISPMRYLVELARSKFVFSPFGWGEVCYRDFEAVALGALLIKPSMDHLVTRPSIYVANETYVCVRWDLADLEEKCHWCLANPGECARIVHNARRALRNYFSRDFAAEVVEAVSNVQA